MLTENTMKCFSFSLIKSHELRSVRFPFQPKDTRQTLMYPTEFPALQFCIFKNSLKIGKPLFKKFKTVLLWGLLRRQFRKVSKNSKVSWGRSSILKFWLPYGAILMKTKKKIMKEQKLKISKIQKSTFVRTTEKKILKKNEKIQKWSEEGVAFCSFCSHRV